MGVIASGILGGECVPGDVLHLRRDLEGLDGGSAGSVDLPAGYYVLLERISYYAALCPAGEDAADGALCMTEERLTVPAEALAHVSSIGVPVEKAQVE